MRKYKFWSFSAEGSSQMAAPVPGPFGGVGGAGQLALRSARSHIRRVASDMLHGPDRARGDAGRRGGEETETVLDPARRGWWVVWPALGAVAPRHAAAIKRYDARESRRSAPRLAMPRRRAWLTPLTPCHGYGRVRVPRGRGLAKAWGGPGCGALRCVCVLPGLRRAQQGPAGPCCNRAGDKVKSDGPAGQACCGCGVRTPGGREDTRVKVMRCSLSSRRAALYEVRPPAFVAAWAPRPVGPSRSGRVRPAGHYGC